MSAAQIPEPILVDFSEDLEAFARSAEEEWRRISSYPLIPALDTAAVPPTPRLRPIPLPPVPPDYDTWGHQDIYDGGGDDRGDDHFPSGGTDNHQSTVQRTNTAPKEATTLTNLALAKPKTIENNDRLESNSPAASSSGGRYNRRQNTNKKIQRFALIREALGIPPTESELRVLEQTIERLGRIAPVVAEPTSDATKDQKVEWKRRARRIYFEELGLLTRSWTGGRVAELKVLDRALEELRNQGDGPSGSGDTYDPYGMFRV